MICAECRGYPQSTGAAAHRSVCNCAAGSRRCSQADTPKRRQRAFWRDRGHRLHRAEEVAVTQRGNYLIRGLANDRFDHRLKHRRVERGNAAASGLSQGLRGALLFPFRPKNSGRRCSLFSCEPRETGSFGRNKDSHRIYSRQGKPNITGSVSHQMHSPLLRLYLVRIGRGRSCRLRRRVAIIPSCSGLLLNRSTVHCCSSFLLLHDAIAPAR
jgi:hypothetical protein